jgi:hypothetical protein
MTMYFCYATSKPCSFPIHAQIAIQYLERCHLAENRNFIRFFFFFQS